jgi:hypothetical protein
MKTALVFGMKMFKGQPIALNVERLREAVANGGRDPSTLDVAYWMPARNRELDQVFEDIPKMAAAGVTVGEFLFTSFIQSPSEAAGFLERLARGLEAHTRVLRTPSGAGQLSASLQDSGSATRYTSISK